MKTTPGTLTVEETRLLLAGQVGDPFAFLGPHAVETPAGPRLAVRVLLPGAEEAAVLDLWPGTAVPARRMAAEGLFEALGPLQPSLKPYRLRAVFDGRPLTFYDAYSFWPVLSDYDLFLFNEGRHFEIYSRLGAHPMRHQAVKGTFFALWAPSAERVSVVGDFNQWDGRRHMLRGRGRSGVWELFVPHLGEGLLYKFEIRTKDGVLLMKADPYAFQFEPRPKTAAVVADLEGHIWGDGEWLKARARTNWLERPMAVYEVHLGSWRRGPDNRWLTYAETADALIPYVKEMGFTHVEFMPLAEHPFDGSWGYQVTGYYAATSRFGAPRDLMALIDRCHQAGIGVIMDWVPAHFPRDPHALEYFDGTHLYEHADPRLGHHQDWDTLIFNYGRHEVRNFLIANALFWLDKYHIDGLRVDAVASMLYLDYSRRAGEWLPNRYGGNENLEAIDLIRTLHSELYQRFPGAFSIAEESTAWPAVSRPVYLGGLGFMFKWNMGWMHDMLQFMSKDPIHRRFHMQSLTFALLYAFHENFILPLSHDEVVHGKAGLLAKMPGDDWQKFANLRLLLGYMYAEPGKKMLFMGGEFGQWAEWDHDRALAWDLLRYPAHQGLKRFVQDLNRLYVSEPALYEQDFEPAGFEWIDFRDTDATVVAFIRRAKDPADCLVFAFNFTPVPRFPYRVGVPGDGIWAEMLNSDAALYGGSNVGMGGAVGAQPQPWHGQPFSVELQLPPLGLVVLKPVTV